MAKHIPRAGMQRQDSVNTSQTTTVSQTSTSTRYPLPAPRPHVTVGAAMIQFVLRLLCPMLNAHLCGKRFQPQRNICHSHKLKWTWLSFISTRNIGLILLSSKTACSYSICSLYHK